MTQRNARRAVESHPTARKKTLVGDGLLGRKVKRTRPQDARAGPGRGPFRAEAGWAADSFSLFYFSRSMFNSILSNFGQI